MFSNRNDTIKSRRVVLEAYSTKPLDSFLLIDLEYCMIIDFVSFLREQSFCSSWYDIFTTPYRIRVLVAYSNAENWMSVQELSLGGHEQKEMRNGKIRGPIILTRVSRIDYQAKSKLFGIS